MKKVRRPTSKKRLRRNYGNVRHEYSNSDEDITASTSELENEEVKSCGTH